MAGKTSKKLAKVATNAAANPPRTAPKSRSRRVAKPTLLAGCNPRIAKSGGNAPVQAYIAAMPGWKRDAGRRLDALILRTVPDVRRAVRWNSPFYGIEGRGWFLGLHLARRFAISKRCCRMREAILIMSSWSP